ncbi:hypothetical protein [Amycolatopsis tolypomycina]|uniref:Uncharacterized protein n=1 Tax=Amycolatopsis tolypomycina TaxID=208445 RepID=A0A1H4T2Q5_9PSEU|nr:hypothetical protein [Amycolatopsis tolypomycina]SEC50444.1 hypothetical protein SAMN04489727_3996 [Amycolatopsis tolypomycina]
MLPNWLYTQNLLPAGIVADAADPAVPREEVFDRLLGSPLNGAPRRGGNWEQTGRALAALGTVCPQTAVAFAGHLAEQHGEARSAPEPYLVQAALLASAGVGIATTAVRARPDGAAATAVLTAQAGILRVLSMLDALGLSGKDTGGTISASFHTVVRGSARLLETSVPDTRVATDHPVLRDEPWQERVTASLAGDWSGFGGAA